MKSYLSGGPFTLSQSHFYTFVGWFPLDVGEDGNPDSGAADSGAPAVDSGSPTADSGAHAVVSSAPLGAQTSDDLPAADASDATPTGEFDDCIFKSADVLTRLSVVAWLRRMQHKFEDAANNGLFSLTSKFISCLYCPVVNVSVQLMPSQKTIRSLVKLSRR